MERKEYIAKLKAELKDLASKISTDKIGEKDHQRKHDGCHSSSIWKLLGIRREFRHKHIAYCLLRGRTLEQIECPSENNKPDLEAVKRHLKDYETLHPCS